MTLQTEGLRQPWNRLVLFHSILNQPAAACRAAGSVGAAYWDTLLAQAATRRLSGNLPVACLVDELLGLTGAFSQLLANTPWQDVPQELQEAAIAEINLLQQEYLASQPDWLGTWPGIAEPQWLRQWPDYDAGAVDGILFLEARQRLVELFLQEDAATFMAALASVYHQLGIGTPARFTSFRWEGKFIGIPCPDPISLTDLIGYPQQKETVCQNVEGFLRYNKGNNMLLYGERGTGKSSLIKAVANAYREQGLRLVELGQSRVDTFRELLEQLRLQRRQHFIVFIDDLSFDRNDKDYRAFKAILEGGAAVIPDNVLLFATSNRRHLIQENWQDRQEAAEEVRVGDTVSEKLSLADRFGVTLVFVSPDQEAYLNIVRGIAQSEGIHLPDEVLCRQALQWAMWQNTRSGRTARQFINHLLGKGGKI